MQTRFDCSIEPLLLSASFIAYSSKQQTSSPTCIVSISSIHNRSTLNFIDLFRISLQLLSQPSLSPPPLLPVTRLLLLLSSMHHRNLLLHKHPRLLLPPPHHCHSPSANASLHHPSTKMLIGMRGTLMPMSALSSSKLMLVFAQTGTTLPVE